MKKVTEYAVLEGINPAELQSKVSQHISNGWQPFGGVSLATFVEKNQNGRNVMTNYSQAMVIYEQ